MSGRNWLTVLLLLAGVPLTAVGLTQGSLLMALGGLVLLLVFIYLVGQALVASGKPDTPIKPAANAAWKMKDEPLDQAGSRDRKD